MKQKKKDKPFKTNAPFGISTKRFCPIGFHPDLDTSGSLNKNKALSGPGPGEYNPQDISCLHKKYCTISTWKRKTDLEEFSKYLGYRNARILKERQHWKAQGGPGTYDINENSFKRKSSSWSENLGFGGEKRFQSFIKYDAPPPDTYFKNITKDIWMKHEQRTNVPSFEWDGFIERFKEDSAPWKKPPNCYDPKDPGSLSALLNKVVSKRGPYDCFTGPRDESTIKNHFAPSSFKGPLNCFYTWPNELETLLSHPKKHHYGKFLKADRFPKKPCIRAMLADLSMCYKDPNHPGPGHYFTDAQKEKKSQVQSICAFNMCVKEARPPINWEIHPGPGRYTIKPIKCLKKKNLSWVFKSQTVRKAF